MTQIKWKIFKSDEDFNRGMERFMQLASGDLTPGTNDFDEFELLNLLIGHYEEKNYPIEKPDPIEAIKFRMDQQGLSQADMREFIGSASKVSEVLNYKRPLSLSMIKRIHSGLGIPADILLQDIEKIEWTPILPETGPISLAITDHSSSNDAKTTHYLDEENFSEVVSINRPVQFTAKQEKSNINSTIRLVDIKFSSQPKINDQTEIQCA